MKRGYFTIIILFIILSLNFIIATENENSNSNQYPCEYNRMCNMKYNFTDRFCQFENEEERTQGQCVLKLDLNEKCDGEYKCKSNYCEAKCAGCQGYCLANPYAIKETPKLKEEETQTDDDLKFQCVKVLEEMGFKYNLDLNFSNTELNKRNALYTVLLNVYNFLPPLVNKKTVQKQIPIMKNI